MSITAPSPTIGPVFPPSTPFVLYSSLTGVSVAQLFLAGVVPGVLMALALMIAVGVVATRHAMPRAERIDWAEILLLLSVNVVARTFQLAGFAWFDEIVQGLFAWMVFIGSAALWRERDHFQVLWLPDVLPPAAARWLRGATVLLSLVFLAVMTWHGLLLTQRARALTPILDLPTSWFYAAIPISGAVMSAYSLVALFQLLTRAPPKP